MHARKTPAGKSRAASANEGDVPGIFMHAVTAKTSAATPMLPTEAGSMLDDDFPWGRVRRLPKKE